MLKWLKSLFVKPPIEPEKPKKRPRLYKQAVVVTTGELPKGEDYAWPFPTTIVPPPTLKRKPALKKATTRKETTMATKPGLYANIHKKQERIEKQKSSGGKVETMRKPGTKGAPTAKAFKEAAKTAKAKK